MESFGIWVGERCADVVLAWYSIQYRKAAKYRWRGGEGCGRRRKRSDAEHRNIVGREWRRSQCRRSCVGVTSSHGNICVQCRSMPQVGVGIAITLTWSARDRSRCLSVNFRGINAAERGYGSASMCRKQLFGCCEIESDAPHRCSDDVCMVFHPCLRSMGPYLAPCAQFF